MHYPPEPHFVYWGLSGDLFRMKENADLIKEIAAQKPIDEPSVKFEELREDTVETEHEMDLSNPVSM